MLQHFKTALVALLSFVLFPSILTAAPEGAPAPEGISGVPPVPDRVYHVAITQIVEHPSLDEIRRGILDELALQGYNPDQNLEVVYDSAQGNIVLATQIAQRFVAQFPDVIVAIATPSAQAVVNAVKDARIPVVFGAVTDPLSAKVAKSLEHPDNNVTGIIDLPPTKAQLEFVREIYPQLKTLGVLYNPGEANTIFQIARIKEAADALGIEILEAAATKTAEVAMAAKSLSGKVEAILLPNDNTVVSALESVLKAADRHQIPVFTSDPDSVKKGAMAALANDQYEIGLSTGKIVAHILSGVSVKDLPIRAVQIAKRYVNKKVAEKLGVTIQADVTF